MGDPDRSEIEPKSNCQTQTQSAGLARSESPMGAPVGSGVWPAFSSVLRANALTQIGPGLIWMYPRELGDGEGDHGFKGKTNDVAMFNSKPSCYYRI